MYIDADMILTPTLLEECVDAMQTSSAVALYIPEIVLGNSLFAKVRRFERTFYTGTSIDACRFFRMSKVGNLRHTSDREGKLSFYFFLSINNKFYPNNP
jgi:hypothetical protein